ncbi:Outer membrane protein assembly factor YaeT precursor [Chitinispirillum alkaliphilum]|nr:Outer membrane protein assembly factor YaeT precursor [Chitinispirillum alkaliphilum]
MKRLSYTLTLLFMFIFGHITDAEVLETISYELTRETSDSDELLEIAKTLVTLKRNQPPDSSSVNESVDALYASRLFESVEITISDGQVNFHLTPALYVRDIRIKGAHPLFADEVEVAMNTYPGDIYSEEMLLIQDSLITELYKREGFVSPKVDISSRVHHSGEHRVINVKIDPGDYYRLDELEIRGNNATSDFGIKRRMKIWRSSLVPGSGGRFLDTDLREDIRTLTDLYRSRRFADIQIRETVVRDTSNNTVRVVIDINEGHRYNLQFSPRRQRGFRRGVLEDDITIFRHGNRNNLGIRNSVRAIGRRMRESGYLDATIEHSDSTIERRRYTERVVYFDIQRGPRTTVSSITLNGVNSIDEDLVLGQMLHVDRGRESRRAFNPEKLEEDVLAIQMLYRSRGFLNAKVSSQVDRKETSAYITINVQEGVRTILNNVTVDTERFSGLDASKAVTVKKGEIFSLSQLNQNARIFQTMIAEMGYPHVEVTPVVKMNSDSSSADVDFRITEGPRIYMGNVRYIGNFRTQERVLNRELKASPGKPLSLKDIVDTQRGLRDLGIFSSSRFRTVGLREKWDTVQVFVEVAEVDPFYGSLSAGFQSDEGPFLSGRIGDRNILGLNKDAWVSAEISPIGYRGETSLMDPRILGTPLRALIGIYGESTSELNVDWGSSAFGFSGGINAPAGKHAVFGLGTNYERRRLFTQNETVPDTLSEIYNDERPRNIVVVKPSFSYDRRDNFTRPRKGVYFSSSVDISRSINNTVDDFVKVQMEARGYVSPLSWLTLAGVARSGYIHPRTKETVIASDQIFYLGGTQNVRGFDRNLFHPEDSSGGKAMFSASIETRIELGLNIELTLFGDIGRLEDDFDSVSSDQFRSSAGLGLRYITPIGPVGLLYGHKLDRKPGESRGAFHFSLGYTF